MYGQDFVDQLRASRQNIIADRNAACSRKQACLDIRAEAGRRKFTDVEASHYHQAVADEKRALLALAEIDQNIAYRESEVRRSGRDNPTVNRVNGSRATVAPEMFDRNQIRGLYQAVQSQTSFRMEARTPVAASTLYPPYQAPWVVGPQHDNRLLSRLPVMPTDSPAIVFIRHTGTTGSAAIVAETAAKPELTFATDSVTLRMQKFAAHVGVGWESLQDFASFEGYVSGELLRAITDAETAELLSGDGTTGHLTGILHTSGILTHATGEDTPLDALEIAIALLRNGAALAEPNLLVVHPLTWSAIRRSKDGQDRYMVSPDPTADEASSVWGVPTLVTTQCTAGTAVLIDTTKFGRVWLREALSVRTGYTNDDLTKNIVRFIGEERLALAVERPAAICSVTGLPTS